MDWFGQDIGPVDVIDYNQHHIIFNYHWTRVGAYVSRQHPSISCLVDELKPLFGLDKIGTLRGHFRGSPIVIQRCLTDDQGYPLVEQPIQLVPQYLPSIKRCLMFRDLLGLNTKLSNLRLRQQAVSYDDVSFKDVGPSTSVLTRSLRNQLFTDYKVELREMIQLTDPQDIVQILTTVRSQVEGVINRVDRDLIWVADRICRRIQGLT